MQERLRQELFTVLIPLRLVCFDRKQTAEHYYKGTLTHQSFAHLLRYSQKFILRGKRYTLISIMVVINFLLCLEYEGNTSCFPVTSDYEEGCDRGRLSFRCITRDHASSILLRRAVSLPALFVISSSISYSISGW